jgi:MFS family permease
MKPSKNEPVLGNHATVGLITGNTIVIGQPNVLHNRPFLLLWLAQLSTQVGGNMVMLGLMVLISANYNGSKIAISGLLLCFLLPPILFSALAGVFVDRVNKRHMLLVTNLIRGLAFVAAFLVGTNLIGLYGLMILVATVTTFFGPAEASMIPHLVTREQLLAANSLFALTTNASFALGFALLGPLVVALAGSEPLLLLVAGFYFVAALFCWTLPTHEAQGLEAGLLSKGALAASGQVVGAAKQTAKGIGGQLSEGFAYIVEHREVGWTLSYMSITGALVGVLAVLGPDFAKTSLGLGDNGLVVIVLPLGLGIVMGILLLSAYGHFFSRTRVIGVGLLVLGVLLTALAYLAPIVRFFDRHLNSHGLTDISQVVSLFSLVLTIAFLAGICYAAVAISAQTQLQEQVPPHVRGRIFGVLNMLVSVASLLPIAVVGPAADLVGAPVILAAVSLGVCLWAVISLRKK